MRRSLVWIAAVGITACGASDRERPTTWTELDGWASHQAEAFRIEGVVRAGDGTQAWVIEGGDGLRWVPMALPESLQLPTLTVEADVRLRPDLLSVGMAGELVEVLRIRPAPGPRSAAEDAAVSEGESGPAVAAAAHPLIGEWRIIGHVAPGVSAMSDARAASWTGRAVEFAATFARSPNGECLTPSYGDRTESVDALMSGEFGVPPASVALVADLDEVDVVEVRCAGTGWGAVGEIVLLLDQRRALTPWDGVFFELRRTR